MSTKKTATLDVKFLDNVKGNIDKGITSVLNGYMNNETYII